MRGSAMKALADDRTSPGQDRIPALGQQTEQLIAAAHLHRGVQLGLGGVRVAVGQVAADGIREQDRVLQDNGDLPPQAAS